MTAFNPQTPEVLLRLPQVLARVPVGKSAWWQGIKTGKFPPGIKVSTRITCWRESDINDLIRNLAAGK